MAGETKHGTGSGGQGFEAECTRFELLLSEALTGSSPARNQESFEAHRRTLRGLRAPVRRSPGRAAVAALARGGRASCKSGAQHSGCDQLASSERSRSAAGVHAVLRMGERAARAGGIRCSRPPLAFVRQPRFAMSFGMIFFSFSLGLSAAGVKPADLARSTCGPARSGTRTMTRRAKW